MEEDTNKMNIDKFTIKTQECLQSAQQTAFEAGHPTIGNTHLLKGISENDEEIISYIFNKTGANLQRVIQANDSILKGLPVVSGNGNAPGLDRDANLSLMQAEQLMKEMGDEYVSIEHLFLALASGKCAVGTMIKDAGA